VSKVNKVSNGRFQLLSSSQAVLSVLQSPYFSFACDSSTLILAQMFRRRPNCATRGWMDGPTC